MRGGRRGNKRMRRRREEKWSGGHEKMKRKGRKEGGVGSGEWGE